MVEIERVAKKGEKVKPGSAYATLILDYVFPKMINFIGKDSFSNRCMVMDFVYYCCLYDRVRDAISDQDVKKLGDEIISFFKKLYCGIRDGNYPTPF